LEIKNITSLVE